MRKLFGFVAFILIIGGVLWYFRGDNGARVKSQLISALGAIPLSDAERADVRQWIESAHQAAFDKAMDLRRKVGERFDAQAYFSDVIGRASSRARDLGREELAEKLEDMRNRLTFTVTDN